MHAARSRFCFASHDRFMSGSASSVAEKAGLAIKRGRPILQVAVYDTVGGVNKIIELPKN